MKVYEVIFQDEYNNLYLLGFYKELKDSLDDVNSYLEQYDTKLDELITYPGTFGEVFDKDIDTDCGCCSIRGFILDDELLKVQSKENNN